jgi:uridylate kinase
MSTYRRILLKLSGEILASDDQNIDPKMLNKVVNIVHSALNIGVEVAIVIGGGNIFRGVNLANAGMNRVTGDHIGMLATVMNALAISDAFVRHNIPCQVMSGLPIGGGVCDSVDHNKAKNALSQGKVVIFSAGTGSPCFTTDTGAAIRAVEIEADIIFKATKVDGIYSSDPLKDPNAVKFESLSFDSAIKKNIQIMDTAAFALCQEHNINICVFSMLDDDKTLANILSGKVLGTTVSQNGD